MSFHEGYLSELVGRAAVVAGDDPQAPIGKVIDFLVTKPDDTFPRIDGLVVKTKSGERYVPMADVVDVDERGSISLRVRPETPAIPENQALYLIRDLFDKRVSLCLRHFRYRCFPYCRTSRVAHLRVLRGGRCTCWFANIASGSMNESTGQS